MTHHSYQQSVVKYFAEKAAEYDLVDDQVYWRLSDELLRTCLERFVLPGLPPSATILDAGGGTGRWTERLLQALPDATALIYDLSPDMTAQARAKSIAGGYADRLEIFVGDLAQLDEHVADQSVDLIISFHNVLGFVHQPDDVVTKLVSRLVPGGRVALFAPNLYHGVFFNISIGDVREATRLLETGRGRFTKSMPDMHFFTAEQLVDSLSAAGADADVIAGTPVFIYPGYAETQLHGQTTRLTDVLDDPARYAAIRALETSALGRPELVHRANNLFISAVRR